MNCLESSGMALEPGRKSKKKASSAVIVSGDCMCGVS